MMSQDASSQNLSYTLFMAADEQGCCRVHSLLHSTGASVSNPCSVILTLSLPIAFALITP